MGRLTGKTALVTGASRGIGRGTAERLARDGARVCVHYGSDEEAASATVRSIREAGGDAFALRQELGVPDDARSLWDAFDAHSDGLDILVNNAGIGIGGPFERVTEQDFDRLLAVNTRAPFFVTQRALPRLRPGGRVVNISSGVARAGVLPDVMVYAMAKAALDVMTRDLAKVLGPRNITVNSVAPGFVDTDANAERLRGDDRARAAAAAMSALGRVGTVADVADIVAFLAGDEARWLTGAWLDASGGSLP
ncbi:SDR family oxidoreductase [Streptomyces sp. NPDC005805]|uniref:SDR family oxidoreductase n=1 Tax=Streptomyces sp. NPDC005805 TaxID=3157068 RepID=UPI0033E84293